MTSRASRRAAMAAGLAGALFVAWLLVSSTGPAGPGDELEPGRAGPEVEEELSEQTETRLEALSEANASGIRWQVQGTVAGAPAPGWVGEQAIDPVADDWEPAIAADPSAPFVYLMTTHFVDKPCPGNCPVPHISLHVSSDGGKTWGSQRPLCACKGSWQFDPVVEVVPNTGAVYAAYLNGFNVVFTRSTDHGTTWSSPVKTYGNVSWNDKPVLATSDDGRDVYISWNGPTGGDPWVAQSHDQGGRLDHSRSSSTPSATSSLSTPTFCMTGRSSSPRATSPTAGRVVRPRVSSSTTCSSRATAGPPGMTGSSTP